MSRIPSSRSRSRRRGRITSKATDLSTSSGLYALAQQSGLQKRADDILKKQQGESPRQIFSGGIISDAFDALNALSYGVVGTVQGKGFKEGVKTRASFTDDLADKGLAGFVVGLGLDIAFDPLTYIAPATILKRIPGAIKLGKATQAAAFGKPVQRVIEGSDRTYEVLEGGTRAGKYLASKFSWMFGHDSIYRETFKRSTLAHAKSTDVIGRLSRGISKMPIETASKIIRKDPTGRWARVPFADLQKTLKSEELEPVKKIYDYIDELGKEAVDLKLLSKEKFEENMGEYLKAAYKEYEEATGVFGKSQAGIKGIKNRKDLTPEQMAELGQIDNPAYLLFKSAMDLSRDVENGKMFREVNKLFGTDVAQDGFMRMPAGKKYGELADKYIPEHMAKHLTEILDPSVKTIGKQAIANFKFYKVIMNPATHARNIVSNRILNWWKLGMNPLDPRSMRAEATAIKEIAKGGGKWADEARPLGWGLDTTAVSEMRSILDSPEAMGFGKGLGGKWGKMKGKLGDLYQAEESHAKLAAYIFNRQAKKMSPEDAWKAAEAATFNYSQVGPWVRKLRESIWGFPFVTFTVKATPVVLETAYKSPRRISVIGKIKNDIERQAGLETERERASEPPWVKDGFYIKLPMKDKHGRSAYFDLTYILPFGDLLSGNFLERPIDRETGLPQNQVVSLAKGFSPFLQVVSEIGRNQNFFGNQIWKESDTSEKQLKDLMTHLTKTYGPPLVADQLPSGYDREGKTVWRGIPGAVGLDGTSVANDENQKRTMMQELLRNVGAKVQPIDADIQEQYAEWNKTRPLKQLLLENFEQTNAKEFSITYTPKSNPEDEE